MKSQPITIMYATVSGTARELAERAAADWAERGGESRVCDIADFSVAQLTSARRLLVIASTCGHGDAPESAERFWRLVVQTPRRLPLSALRYSVLALGCRDFERFCACGRAIDAALARHGARRLAPRVDSDIHVEASYQRWSETVMARLAAQESELASGSTIQNFRPGQNREGRRKSRIPRLKTMGRST